MVDDRHTSKQDFDKTEEYPPLKEDLKKTYLQIKKESPTRFIPILLTILYILKEIFPGQFIRRFLSKKLRNYTRRKDACIVEIWVIASLIIAYISAFVLSGAKIEIYTWILFIFAIYRIFEIVTYQSYVVLLGSKLAEQEESHRLRGIRRMIILLLLNYVEIIAWFAVFYRFFYLSFTSQNFNLNSFSGSLYHSVVTMTTLGYGDVTPINNTGMFIVSLQTLIGIFIALIVIARFIATIGKYPEMKNKTQK